MSFIDGLSSGLDTTAIIDAIMAVERLPQNRIIQRRARSEQASDELGKLRTSVMNLRNSAADLRLGSGWQRLKGISSSDSVSVETTAGGFTGAITFRVDALATSHVTYSDTEFASLDTVVGAGGTLGEVIAGINADTDLNFTAVAVQTGSGFRLQLSAKEGGAGSVIDTSGTTLLDGAGTFSTLTNGADAQITFDGLNPYSITSTSNTFDDLMPGVDVTVSEVSTNPVTVTVANDFEQIADSVGALVEQFNELRTNIQSQSRVDPALDVQPPLAFNSSVRRAEQGLVRAFVDPVDASSFSAPSLVGIEIQRDGSITFDREAFIEAAETDLDQLTRLFIGPEGEEAGMLDRLVDAADVAGKFGEGLLATAEETERSRIQAYTDQIDTFEDRFERKEAQLRRIYANLEVAIGGLSTQSNWLAGQLATLSTPNGDN